MAIASQTPSKARFDLPVPQRITRAAVEREVGKVENQVRREINTRDN